MDSQQEWYHWQEQELDSLLLQYQVKGLQRHFLVLAAATARTAQERQSAAECSNLVVYIELNHLTFTAT
jgi:hypothetical protein